MHRHKGQSGNPNGRPKGSKNFESVLARELGEKLEVRENGRLKRISKLELSAKQVVNGAAAGKLPYIQFLQPLMEKFRVQEERRRVLAERKAVVQPDLSYYVQVLKILKEFRDSTQTKNATTLPMNGVLQLFKRYGTEIK